MISTIMWIDDPKAFLEINYTDLQKAVQSCCDTYNNKHHENLVKEEDVFYHMALGFLSRKFKYDSSKCMLRVYINMVICWSMRDALREQEENNHPEDSLDFDPEDTNSLDVFQKLYWEDALHTAKGLPLTPREQSIKGNANQMYMELSTEGYSDVEIAKKLKMPYSFTNMLMRKLKTYSHAFKEAA